MAITVTFTLEGPLSARGAVTMQVLDYSVTEDATPLAAGDSSGSVGTFTVVVPRNSGAFSDTAQPFREILDVMGPTVMVGSEVRIFDSRKGFTLGTVRGVVESRDGATVTLSGVSRLGKLNVYGIQAQPYVGTLRGAFNYYLSLAGITTDVFVDDAIGDRPVVFQGWHGELWYSLKQMAVAQHCDLSLVSGVILLRGIRQRIASQNRDTSRSITTGGETLAQSVEVYQYSNRAIANELVYPAGGWNEGVEVMNVNAGETAEYTLALSSSLTSIQPPEMRTFVGQDYSASSVYTIVANDGLPVPPALWADFGGSVEVSISPDTKSLEVVLRGALGLPLASGVEASNFSVALGSDTTGNRYSTFRIVGTGVAFDKVKHRIRTGVPASMTATEVGVTIDNPFISTVDERYQAGIPAARRFAGPVMALSGNVISLNRRGDTGQAQYPTYEDVQNEVQSRLGPGATYADVQALFPGMTYAQVRDYWFDFFRDEDADQVFGNAQGARVFDKKSRRWYRIRNATPVPGDISLQADDDLTYADLEEFYPAGTTYADMQARFQDFTYMQAEMAGLVP